MMNDIQLHLEGPDALFKIIRGLEVNTQHKILIRVLNDTAQKTFIKALRREAPVRTGKLRRSMGRVTGKSRRVATIFAGPRTGGRDERHEGWVANILEHAKSGKRYPKGRILATPWGPRRSVGPIRKRTNFKGVILGTVRQAESHMFKSIRTIMEREIQKYARR